MVMKKFINDPANLTAELLEGFTLAYADKVKLESGKLVVRARPKAPDKVALVTLGGAGHEPALSGFVGEGMLDISVVGDIFAAPAAPEGLRGLEESQPPGGRAPGGAQSCRRRDERESGHGNGQEAGPQRPHAAHA